MSSLLDPGDGTAGATSRIAVLPVSDSQWEIVRWLWQLFRHDLAGIVSGLPYGDGRYQSAKLDGFPSRGGVGYLAWKAHPKTGEPAPVGFALVDGLAEARRTVEGFWVAPVIRREGVGQLLALDVLSRHRGPWSISFQHDNHQAGAFWRKIADVSFGRGRWTEVRRPVPGLANVPADHTIESN